MHVSQSSLLRQVLHTAGLGDSGQGWSDVGAQFAAQLPHVKFIFPTAPVQPVTINMGMRMNSWCAAVTLLSMTSGHRPDLAAMLTHSRTVQV